jgi:hypothetical protein
LTPKSSAASRGLMRKAGLAPGKVHHVSPHAAIIEATEG